MWWLLGAWLLVVVFTLCLCKAGNYDEEEE